jgi:hypothetical protein
MGADRVARRTAAWSVAGRGVTRGGGGDGVIVAGSGSWNE